MTDRERDFQLGLNIIGTEPYAGAWTDAFLSELEGKVGRWTLELEYIEGRLAFYQKAQEEVSQQLAAAEQELARMQEMVDSLRSRSTVSRN